MKSWRTTYRVVLEAPEGNDLAPPVVRLRHALKRAWRQDALKCREVRQLSIDGDWGPVDCSLPLVDGAGI